MRLIWRSYTGLYRLSLLHIAAYQRMCSNGAGKGTHTARVNATRHATLRDTAWRRSFAQQSIIY